MVVYLYVDVYYICSKYLLLESNFVLDYTDDRLTSYLSHKCTYIHTYIYAAAIFQLPIKSRHQNNMSELSKTPHHISIEYRKQVCTHTTTYANKHKHMYLR